MLLYLEYIRSYYEYDDESRSFYNPNYIKLIQPKHLELDEIITDHIGRNDIHRKKVYVRFRFQLLSHLFFSEAYMYYLIWGN